MGQSKAQVNPASYQRNAEPAPMSNIIAVAGIVIKELYRRKDFYVLFVLTVLICLVMASVRIFNDAHIVRYLKELCLLLIWIASLVIAITTTARQIPAERENRTLFPLLAKPLSRTELLLGKFFGCWLACGLALLCFYLFFGLLAASREHHWLVGNYFQAAALHWSMLAVVIALTLLGSLVFAAPSSTTTICFIVVTGILFLGRHLNKVALQLPEPRRSILYSVYFAIPHLELFDVRDLIIHDWARIPWPVCGVASFYAAAYVALFLIAACLVFQRRAIN
jgi:ABC-type transport system involved in multi-copper enzyme maturation permease subunit